jgi:hypothetical protein
VVEMNSDIKQTGRKDCAVKVSLARTKDKEGQSKERKARLKETINDMNECLELFGGVYVILALFEVITT